MILRITLIVALFSLASFFWISTPTHPSYQVLSNPIDIGYGVNLQGTENLMWVPENWAEPNDRTIGLHYFHFPAREPKGLAPVFYFRGGPGEATTPRGFYQFYGGPRIGAFAWEVERLNRHHDVVLITQRGVDRARGLPYYNFRFQYWKGSAEDRASRQNVGQAHNRALLDTLEHARTLGINVAGYTVQNMVADIEAVRQQHGYEKIALVGNSFGSQLALTYAHLYPSKVDRALLSAVEPVDYGYDDPKTIWETWSRVAQVVDQDPYWQDKFDGQPLLSVYKTLLKRLEEQPVTVTLDVPGEEAQDVEIGVEDLKRFPGFLFANSREEQWTSWPAYLHALYTGDYRCMAMAIVVTSGYETDPAMPRLVDHSLGISTERNQQLLHRPEVQWLGDPNRYQRWVAEAKPTVTLTDEERALRELPFPTLLIHGDADLNTPLANAEDQLAYLPQGHLITVRQGTHGTKWDLFNHDRGLAEQILAFMDLSEEESAETYFRTELPRETHFPKFQFWKEEPEALFEKALAD
ncbi:MAG: alpha/beta fold hydrolase [Bacteroidota bacterium]